MSQPTLPEIVGIIRRAVLPSSAARAVGVRRGVPHPQLPRDAPSTPGGARGGKSAWKATYPLANSPTSAAVARRLLRQALEDCQRETVETAELLVSELVTNAVLHARTAPVLCIQIDRPGIRVTVEDSSVDPPSLATEATYAERGRGMLILDALASAWGWEPLPTGKRVWFEIQQEQTG